MFKLYVYKQPYNPAKGVQRKKLRKLVLEITLGRDQLNQYDLFDYDIYNNDKIQRSLRRSKTTVSDLILTNKFTHFATFTFNCKSCPKRFNCKNKPCLCPPDYCKRFDDSHITSKMSVWLDNNVRKHGMKYVLVPERHKSGALHFHALISDYSGNMKDSGRRRNHRTVYNLTGFRSGFTDVEEVQSVQAVSNYIKKYFTKDMALIRGNKRYWASRNLQRPIKQRNKKIKVLDIFKKHIYEAQFYDEYYIPKLKLSDNRGITSLSLTSIYNQLK